MKLRKIFILISIVLLASLSALSMVFAEYYFIKTIQDGQVDLGTIVLGDAKYLSYANKNAKGEYTTENVDEPEEIDASIGSMVCYASKKTGFYLEGKNISLSQLGYQFSYKTTVDAYVRVKIEDAWISQKFYSGSKEPNNTSISKDNRSSYIKATNVNENNYSKYYTLTPTKANSYEDGVKYYTYANQNYIDAGKVVEADFANNTYYTISAVKATSYSESAAYYFNSNSPFSVQNDNWIYVPETGYLYYTVRAEASDDTQVVNFRFDDSYFYPIESNVGFIESILVNLEFSIEIVQANRAAAKWGADVFEFLK